MMKPCCGKSIRRYLKKHRDVAVCDGCGNLLLAYGNVRDWEETQKALGNQGTPYETADHGSLWVIAKPRASKR